MCAPMIPMMLTLVSTAASAYGQMQSASYTAAIANRNAKQAEFNAQDAIARGEQKADAERRKVGYKIGAQRVAMASSGIDTGSGMGIDIIGDTALVGELDTQVIRQNAGREAVAYQNQAENFRLQADQSRSTGLWNTVGTVIGGAGDFYNKGQKAFPNFFS
jgi:hypothetical protein